LITIGRLILAWHDTPKQINLCSLYFLVSQPLPKTDKLFCIDGVRVTLHMYGQRNTRTIMYDVAGLCFQVNAWEM